MIIDDVESKEDADAHEAEEIIADEDDQKDGDDDATSEKENIPSSVKREGRPEVISISEESNDNMISDNSNDNEKEYDAIDNGVGVVSDSQADEDIGM